MWLVMLLVSAVTWTLHIAASAVLWAIGWPVCGYLAARNRVIETYVSRFGRTLYEWQPRWAFIWSNDEDGIDGLRGGDQAQLSWLEQTKNLSDVARILRWSCWRNPIGNLRFVKPFGFTIDPTRVRWIGNSIDPDADYDVDPKPTRWYFASHGLYTGAWIIFKAVAINNFGWRVWRLRFVTAYFQIRIGWKIIPRDAGGVDASDYRSKGCGFALQLQRK